VGISAWHLRTYAANLELCDPAPTSVLLFIGNLEEEKKTLYIKIKNGNPSIKSTRQMTAGVDTTQRKNESKQSTNKITNKTPV
jgi:hypothetical protein